MRQHEIQLLLYGREDAGHPSRLLLFFLLLALALLVLAEMCFARRIAEAGLLATRVAMVVWATEGFTERALVFRRLWDFVDGWGRR